MITLKVIAITLVVAGTLALAYGGFSYTSNTHDIELAGVQLSLEERETVNVPVWPGAGLIVLGSLLLLTNKSA